ncbi:MAG: AbrB/MazE/SpoVT family DNA-binding domain-containing protein, partial [Deferrisomatales bacterium]
MKITSKGQVTIPQELREQLGFLPGSKVRFIPEGNTSTGGQRRRTRWARQPGRRTTAGQSHCLDDHRGDSRPHPGDSNSRCLPETSCSGLRQGD